ncbi:MAG: BlaI/MecI/CopY family transcriptional regulator [Bacteroidetes bacterium]|nr:BlaI/MecI/CopY family transcriptional regulator [Bacteroidota bacterium]
MKELTKAEEQIMHILWEIKSGSVNDIIKHYREPRPKYTTISTIIRILETKGFIGHKKVSKAFHYHPLVDKQIYTRILMRGILAKYFGNSLRQMVSFLSHEKSLSVTELEELKNIIEEEIRMQRQL